MTDEIELIKFVVQNWNTIKQIPRDVWKKIRELYQSGDKALGFIRRKPVFENLVLLSKSTFIQKYSKYIIPTEYRGYLLESINISQVYERGEKDEGDKKRKELHETDSKALRIYNLYNSGVLSALFSHIDKLIAEGKNDTEITGSASKVLDDLINDKSIIYVNLSHSQEGLFMDMKKALKERGFCILCGSGTDNTKKILHVQSEMMEDKELSNFSIQLNRYEIGDIKHVNAVIYEKAKIVEKENVNGKKTDSKDGGHL